MNNCICTHHSTIQTHWPYHINSINQQIHNNILTQIYVFLNDVLKEQ